MLMGIGDMNKPIYRYLADKKWREYQRKVIVQRIEQLGIVPDALPYFEPTAEVKLAFRSRKVQPGEYVDSRISEVPCRLNVQVFDKGERLVTVVVMDNDVPLAELDTFGTRCHFIAANLPLSPIDDSLPLTKRDPETQVALPWLSPYAQKGSPYHRYTVWVLQQDPEKKVDVKELKELERDNFDMRWFVGKFSVKPIGMAVFRSTWDEGTAGVMEKNGVEGADIEFKRKRVIAIKPKEKKRGWEARHSSDKYKPLGMAGRWKK
jgi:large subunit ribosomal protein L35